MINISSITMVIFFIHIACCVSFAHETTSSTLATKTVFQQKDTIERLNQNRDAIRTKIQTPDTPFAFQHIVNTYDHHFPDQSLTGIGQAVDFDSSVGLFRNTQNKGRGVLPGRTVQKNFSSQDIHAALDPDDSLSVNMQETLWLAADKAPVTDDTIGRYQTLAKGLIHNWFGISALQQFIERLPQGEVLFFVLIELGLIEQEDGLFRIKKTDMDMETLYQLLQKGKKRAIDKLKKGKYGILVINTETHLLSQKREWFDFLKDTSKKERFFTLLRDCQHATPVQPLLRGDVTLDTFLAAHPAIKNRVYETLQAQKEKLRERPYFRNALDKPLWNFFSSYMPPDLALGKLNAFWRVFGQTGDVHAAAKALSEPTETPHILQQLFLEPAMGLFSMETIRAMLPYIKNSPIPKDSNDKESFLAFLRDPTNAMTARQLRSIMKDAINHYRAGERSELEKVFSPSILKDFSDNKDWLQWHTAFTDFLMTTDRRFQRLHYLKLVYAPTEVDGNNVTINRRRYGHKGALKSWLMEQGGLLTRSKDDTNMIAIREALANDILRDAWGFPGQNLTIRMARYKDGSPALILDGEGVENPYGAVAKDVSDHTHLGYFVELDEKGNPIIEDGHFIEHPFALIWGRAKGAFSLFGDWDTWGSNGNNKMYIGYGLWIIDTGHSFEIIYLKEKNIASDFFISDPGDGLPDHDYNLDDMPFGEKMTRKNFHVYKKKNFCVLDSSPLSEKMKFLRILRDSNKDIDIFDRYISILQAIPELRVYAEELKNIKASYMGRRNYMLKDVFVSLMPFLDEKAEHHIYTIRDGLEKLTSKTSLYSKKYEEKNGKEYRVKLRRPRIDAPENRKEWEIQIIDNGYRFYYAYTDQKDAEAVREQLTGFFERFDPERQMHIGQEDYSVYVDIASEHLSVWRDAVFVHRIKQFKHGEKGPMPLESEPELLHHLHAQYPNFYFVTESHTGELEWHIDTKGENTVGYLRLPQSLTNPQVQKFFMQWGKTATVLRLLHAKKYGIAVGSQTSVNFLDEPLLQTIKKGHLTQQTDMQPQMDITYLEDSLLWTLKTMRSQDIEAVLNYLEPVFSRWDKHSFTFSSYAKMIRDLLQLAQTQSFRDLTLDRHLSDSFLEQCTAQGVNVSEYLPGKTLAFLLSCA